MFVVSLYLVFTEACSTTLMRSGVDVRTDDMFRLVAEGLDVGTRDFDRVLASRTKLSPRDSRARMEMMLDVSTTLSRYTYVKFFGGGVHGFQVDPTDSISESGELDADYLVELSRRRPAWVVPRALLLVGKYDSDAGTVELRALLGLELEATQSIVESALAFAVRMGRAALVRDRLDRTGLADEWLPTRHALHAISIGSKEVLDGLAPEVREPAAIYYDRWSPLTRLRIGGSNA